MVQRRLYRNGESVYLIDGKPCRLRDIQDMFLGTGLGPNSYAIIEQGRVGQLLSSKPMDRRALIEEAAGVTKFKAKRKLAESRLEAARQNLSRVNDILAEVDRQRNSLKRQAGKARRYIELRNRMREILSAVFSTRAEMLVHQQEACEASLASIGDEGRRLGSRNRTPECTRSSASHRCRRPRECADGDAHASRRSGTRIRKSRRRIERLEDQIRSLEERKTALAEEGARIVEELDPQSWRIRPCESRSLEELEQTRIGIVESLELVKAEIARRTAERQAEERSIEQLRRQQFEIVATEARFRNEITSRGEMIQRLSMQIERLEREASEVHELIERIGQQLTAARDEHLEHQSGMSQLRTRLTETEQECVRLKNLHVESVLTTAAAKSNQDANPEPAADHRRPGGQPRVQHRVGTAVLQSRAWIGLAAAGNAGGFHRSRDELRSPSSKHSCGTNCSTSWCRIDPMRNASSVSFEISRRDDWSAWFSTETIPPIPRIHRKRFQAPRQWPASSVSMIACGILRAGFAMLTLWRSLADAWELSGRYPHCRFVAKSGEVVQGYVVGWGQQDELGPSGSET